MNVKELKEFIAALPDEMEVITFDHMDNLFSVDPEVMFYDEKLRKIVDPWNVPLPGGLIEVLLV